MASMNIVVLAPDTPYPANRGGRADIWRRILAFKALGHRVYLIHLQETQAPLRPAAGDLAAMDAVVDGRFSFPIKRGLLRSVRQLLGMGRLPWHAATRVPSPSELAELLPKVQTFQPDLLWLEGPWFGWLTEELRRHGGIRVAYRSHNVEHLYLRGQARVASSVRNRLAWTLATVGLHRYEMWLMRNANHVFDISMDDLNFWRKQGICHNSWLPPLPDLAVRSWPIERYSADLLFVGNLKTPNNLQGLRWLLDEVMPTLRSWRPELKLTIVGSQASAAVQDELQRRSDVNLHQDVPDVAPYLLGARVLLNPVSIGSGVQLKTLDMLMTDTPIVTRAQGLRGLPPSCWDTVAVAEEPLAFATAVLEAHSNVQRKSIDRSELRKAFTHAGIAAALTHLEMS